MKCQIHKKRAIITLLYKKGDPELLQNWRPISLLNTDYKIGAFVIGNRPQSVMSKLISSDQTAYLRGRYIGSNIRLVEDIFDQSEKGEAEGAVLFCDFEKAFDTLEIQFIIKVLEKFKFGDDLQRWVKTFYNNIDACVKCNNWISKPLQVKRGIRQGCPVSALLFVLVAEIMAINIQCNVNVKGIKLPGRKNKEAKISQVADDTTMFLKDFSSIVNAIEEIKRFSAVAGMKLNVQKTVGVRLGKFNTCNQTVGEISWTTDLVKALGVYFGHDVKKRIKRNWEEKISQMEQSLKSWDKRNLTMLGRIVVVKTFAVSKLVYLSSVMECTEEYLK